MTQATLFPEPKKQRSKHKQFVELWCAAYQQHFKHKFAFNARHAKIVDELVKSTEESAAELVDIAKRAWKSSAFWCSKCNSLATFAQHINEVRVELSATKSKSAGWKDEV